MTIFFGHYPQSSPNAKPEPIEWIVLDEADGLMLLLSKYALDEMPFGGSSWDSSRIRSWLNGEFLKNAFSEDEQHLIQTVFINEEGLKHQSQKAGGSDDQVFLLSHGEVNNYLHHPDNRTARRTAYACSGLEDTADADVSIWWLRNSGIEPYDGAIRHFVPMAMDVIDGEVNEYGLETDEPASVRPAIWIKAL